MMFPNEGKIPIVKPNLGFQDEQDNIINQLNSLAWKRKMSLDHYRRLSFSLKREEANIEYWEGVLQERRLREVSLL